MRRPTWLMAFVPENNLRWNQWNEGHKHCVNLYFCTNTWLLELKTSEQAGGGVNRWFAKTEMRREWEAMNTAPDRHHEPHGGTNVCYSLFWSSHADNIPTHIHRNIKDNFLAHLFLVCYCHFWSPSPPPLKISCTVLRVVTGETTRGIPKIFFYIPKVLGSWDHGLKWHYPFLSHKKLLSHPMPSKV